MADLPFTLDQLRILRAIASEGSFKKAADSLYVTQPAVSLQIQNLEKQLDVSLFDRGGRKAQLTEAGHLLLSYSERILSQCQEACRALDDLHNLKGGSLIVGASQTTGTYLMPRMIGLFRQKYPDVSVQLQVHTDWRARVLQEQSFDPRSPVKSLCSSPTRQSQKRMVKDAWGSRNALAKGAALGATPTRYDRRASNSSPGRRASASPGFRVVG